MLDLRVRAQTSAPARPAGGALWGWMRRAWLGGGWLWLWLWLCLVAGGPAAQAADRTPPPSVSEEAEPASPDVVPGQYLVRFRPGVSEVRRHAVLTEAGGAVRRLRTVQGMSPVWRRASVAGVGGTDDLVLLELPADAPAETTLARLRRQRDVLYVEPNFRLRLAREREAGRVPDDFDFGRQWGLRNTGQTGGTPGADIDAPAAWAVSTGDRGVIVAVLDTGVDYFHPELEGNLFRNPGEVPGNGLDDDENGFIDDVHGYDFVSDDSDPMDDNNHGTHVAGIVGALGNNGQGVAGVCWTVSLMAVKAFDEGGNSDVATVIEAMRYAEGNGARILNASWGLADRSRALQEAVSQAYAAGVLVVAAAGNQRNNVPFYPAAYADVLAVAATDARDQRASFSSYGTYVDLAAPGENICSTVPDNRYECLSGTSMAAPLVSGVAALVLARHPTFTVREVDAILRNAVDWVPTEEPMGSGRLNAGRALRIEAPLPEAALRVPEVLFARPALEGTAAGPRFLDYALAHGPGRNPTNWTTFHTATVPVEGGVLLASFETGALADGEYTLRLTVRDTQGQAAVERRVVQVRNVHLSSPRHNDVRRAGDVLELTGTVFGPGLRFTLEHGTGWQPSVWQRDGIQLARGGEADVVEGVLGRWDTAQVASNQFYTLRLRAWRGAALARESTVHMVFLDSRLRAGWPRYLPVTGEFPTEEWRQITVADLEGDGQQELVLVDHGNSDGVPARLLVYRLDGSLAWSRTLASGEPYADAPVVGDVDGDGRAEIFVDVGERGEVFGFDADGRDLAGWPVRVEAGRLGKVLADLDGDGRLELIAYSGASVGSGTQEMRQLTVFDAAGHVRQAWEVPACPRSRDALRQHPAVGNFDRDPQLELAVVSGCNVVSVYKLGRAIPLWNGAAQGTLVASPVAGDLDGDGVDEAILGAYQDEGQRQGGLYAFGASGVPLRGWPVLLEESFEGPAALADLDGDGRLEIAVASWKGKRMYVVHAHGFAAQGWPLEAFSRGSAKSAPAIVDLDGDGQLDVALASPGLLIHAMVSGDLGAFGGLRAWTARGVPLDLNPHPGLEVLLMESSGGASRSKFAPITVTDLDGDGRLDLVGASLEDRAYHPDGPPYEVKGRSSLYVWELGTPWRETSAPWPAFQHDAQHTGRHLRRPVPNQPPAVAALPDQTIRTGGTFLPIELDYYVEDPDNPPDQMLWRVEGQRELEVSVGADRVARVRAPGPGWVGQETLRFVATDPGGLSAVTRATFTVRRDYVPPVAEPDRGMTDEDVPVELDVLANDRDPQGDALFVVHTRRPRHGTVEPADGGRLRYEPERDFAGLDEFQYTVSDGQGGLATATVQVEVRPLNDPPSPQPDRLILDEDVPGEVDVLANDLDVDGDPLAVIGFTQGAHGAVVQTVPGRFRYEPVRDFNGLDQFTYRVADPAGAEAEAAVSVMVKPVNDPPIVADQRVSLNRNTSVDISLSATDPEGSEVTFRIVDGPEQGELWNYPRLATYFPKKGFSGDDRFTYRANDGLEDSALATVRLEVSAHNNLPVAASQKVATKTGQPRAITLTATDADDDPLTFQLEARPAHGRLTGEAPDLTYTPDPGYLGEDRFTFRASDGVAVSGETTVQIQVTDRNTAPVAEEAVLTVRPNATTRVTLKASDEEGDPLQFEVVSPPEHGALAGQPPDLHYTPALDFVGADRFTFRASDGELASEPGTVTLNVQFANEPPTAHGLALEGRRARPVSFALPVTDPDGDWLRAVILKGPPHGRVSGTGTNFVYRPDAGFLGEDSFTYKVWDGRAYSKVAQVTVRVTEPDPWAELRFKSIQRLAAGRFQLVLGAGQPVALELQASTDLRQWTTLVTVAPGVTSFTFEDPESDRWPHRFYRARQAGARRLNESLVPPGE